MSCGRKIGPFDCCSVIAGDAYELISGIPNGSVDALICDPPYGINYKSTHNSHRKGEWAKWVREDNFESILGDDKPFDPTPLLRFKFLAMFGANYFSSRLPDSKCWIVWDKRHGIGSNDFADCELIWTNLQKPSRIFRHVWSGLIRAGEENVSRSPKLHPHQKPVALMKYLCELSEAETVLDPFCGSGSTLVAAKRLGKHFLGFELDDAHFATASQRLAKEMSQMVLV